MAPETPTMTILFTNLSHPIFFFFKCEDSYLFQRCFVDYRTTAGKRFAQVIGIIEMVTFGILAVSYGAIWMKIRQSSKVVDASIQRCNRTAKMMMIFVVSFFFQWWIQCVIVIWTYILGTMPSFIPVISGCVVNMGGVYDCVAYTIIRRKFQKRVSPA